MSLTRAALVSITAGELAQVLALAGLGTTDETGALKEPIDQTLRALGVAESALATATIADGGETAAIAYATYFTLRRAVLATTAKMDVKAGSASASLRQQFENLRDQMHEALVIAQGYGLVIAGAGSSGVTPMPFAGGIRQSDRDMVISSGDRVPPLFSLDDLRIPGVERLGVSLTVLP